MCTPLPVSAFRYAGSVAIRVRLPQGAETAGRFPRRLRFEVSDTGIGIPESDRQRVFEAFERGSNVGPIKGTGLGLNIVKRMAELLSGTVSVDSAPGRGSRFTVELPRLVR